MDEENGSRGDEPGRADAPRPRASTRYLTTRPEPGEKLPGIVVLTIVAALLFILVVMAGRSSIEAMALFGTAVAWATILVGVLLAIRDAFARRVCIPGVVLVLAGVLISSGGAWGPAVGVAAVVTAALFVERSTD